MRFRDWKKEIENTNFEIPNVYEKIKSFAYSRDFTPKSTIHIYKIMPFRKLAYMLASSLFLFTLVFAISSKERFVKEIPETYEGVLNLSSVNNQEEMINLLTIQNNTGVFYKSQKSFYDLIKRSKTDSDFSIPDFENFNEMTMPSEADIVKADGNFLYYANSNYFYAFKNNNGRIEELYKEQYSQNSLRVLFNNTPYHNVIHVTDKYVIFIYSDEIIDRLSNHQGYWDIRHKYGESHYLNKVVVYDKLTLNKVKTYEIEGNLVDVRLINQSLYLITNINFGGYLTLVKSIPLPKIIIDGAIQELSIKDVQFSTDNVGPSYTVISTLFLGETVQASQYIQLSNHKWDVVYFSNSNLYLINTFVNKNNPNLANEKYTIVFKYNLFANSVNYSSSVIYLGEAISQYAFDERSGFLRVVTTAPNYKSINVAENNLSVNKVLIFEERSVENGKKMYLFSELSQGIGNSSEKIKSVKFNQNALSITVQSSNGPNPVYLVDLSDPFLPTIINTFDEKPIKNYLHKLNDQNLVSIGFTSTYLYRMTFYKKLNNEIIPWQNNVTYDIAASYIEAIYNNNAVLITEDENHEIFGFGVQRLYVNATQTDISYLLFVIDVNNNSYEVKSFTHSSSDYIRRMVKFAGASIIYFSISNEKIVSYDSNFNVIDSLNI